MVQVTRGEAREVDLDTFECGECEASGSAYREGRAAAYAEIVEMLRVYIAEVDAVHRAQRSDYTDGKADALSAVLGSVERLAEEQSQ